MVSALHYRGSSLVARVTAYGEAEEGAWRELGAIAAALGAPYRGGRAVAVVMDGLEVSIELLLSSGPVGVVLVVTRDRALADEPALTIEPEHDWHRSAKTQGIAGEVQTGDAAFDARFFVGGTASFDEGRRLLAAPGSRDRISWVFDARLAASHPESCLEVTHLRLSPQRVVLRAKMGEDVYAAEPVLALLEELLALARGEAPRGPTFQRRGGCLVALLVLAVPVAAYGSYLEVAEWESSWLLVLVPALIGLLSVAPFERAWRRYVSGHPASMGPYQAGLVLSMCLLVLGGPGLALRANRQLDASPERFETGTVVAMDRQLDADCDDFEIRWQDGEVDEHALCEGAIGQVYERGFGPGWLGFKWRRRALRLVADAPSR